MFRWQASEFYLTYKGEYVGRVFRTIDVWYCIKDGDISKEFASMQTAKDALMLLVSKEMESK